MLVWIAWMARPAEANTDNPAATPTVLFKPIQKFHTSQNKWILAFNIELQPYTAVILQMKDRIRGLSPQAQTVADRYDQLQRKPNPDSWYTTYMWLATEQIL